MKNLSNYFMYILGALIVVGFFTLLYMLAKTPVPAENKDALNLVIGSLLAAFSAVVGYFYGSSKGSSDKTAMMNENNKQTPQV